MKQFESLIVGLVVFGVIVGFWWFSRGGGATSEAGERDPSDGSAVIGSVGPQRDRASEPTPRSMPAWALAEPKPARVASWSPPGLPPVIFELAGLCHGHSALACNTLAVKQKLLEFAAALPTMTEEELQAIAEFFRNSDQPGFKYHMLIAFRSYCGDPFVDVIEEYYENEPHRVVEALQYMVLRTPKAADGLARILEREPDPERRVHVLAAAGFSGQPAAKDLLSRALDIPDSPERRIAVTSLARTQDRAALDRIWGIADGDYEEAVYDVTEDAPTLDEQRDLRAHAVTALLTYGSKDDVQRLVDRLKAPGADDDPIARYVNVFFPAVMQPGFVDDVVDVMRRRGKVSRELLLYVRRVGTPQDLPLVATLLDHAETDDERLMVNTLMDAIR